MIMIENFLPLDLKEDSYFICPVCGNEISGEDNSDVCGHVLFIHDKEANELVYCAYQCQEIVESDDPDTLQTLIGELKATTTIFFEVTFTEPTKQVLTIGIDLSL
jgi:hypothetical protein